MVFHCDYLCKQIQVNYLSLVVKGSPSSLEAKEPIATVVYHARLDLAGTARSGFFLMKKKETPRRVLLKRREVIETCLGLMRCNAPREMQLLHQIILLETSG